MGRLAQLVEHSVYTRKVTGSKPVPPISTTGTGFRRFGARKKEGGNGLCANTLLTTQSFSMAVSRTDIEWRYDPTDFFEKRFQCSERDFVLEIENGRALATLKVPKRPADTLNSFLPHTE